MTKWAFGDFGPYLRKNLRSKGPLLGPFGPLQLHGHQIVGVRALGLNSVALPPGEIPSELEGG